MIMVSITRMSCGEYVHYLVLCPFQCHFYMLAGYSITILLHHSRLLGSQALSVSFKGF